MKLGIAIVFAFIAATSNAADLPDENVLASQVDGGHVTNRMLIKFKPKNDKAIQGYVQRTLAKTKFCTARRMIPPVEKFEEEHKAFGFHLWYEFDCSDMFNFPGKGKGVQKAIEQLAAVGSGELDNKYGIVRVEPAFEVNLNITVDVPSDQPPKNNNRLLRGTAEERQLYSSNDPGLISQGHYNTILLSEAWNTMINKGAWANAKDVVVQVLDTGWNMAHPDLGANRWVNPGENCDDGIDNDGNGYVDDCHGYNHIDDNGGSGDTDLLGTGNHGSHVAGTISADTDNGIGVAGIAGGYKTEETVFAGVSIMTSVCFGSTGSGNFAAALLYGANNGAHISSNSWGYTCPNCFNQAVLDAIDYADSKGVVVVFAANNFASNEPYYPAYYSKAVAVAATNTNRVAASFTNYGNWVDIAAPGVNVYSTDGGSDYINLSGTSMACPHVSAVLALGKALKPTATAQELKNCLFSSADNIDSLQTSQYVGQLGAGMVNSAAFLQCLTPCSVNTDCDDGNYCNGAEMCLSGSCVAGTDPCPGQSCSEDTDTCVACAIFELQLLTDNYASETSWTLVNECTEQGVVLSGDNYANNQDYTETACISPYAQYTFTINDSYGDGICCGYGVGSYSILFDGDSIETPSNGEFGSSESTTFGTCGCATDNDCDDGLFCNGAEICVGTTCQPGTPVDCNDNVNCTVDSCNEDTDTCDNVADDSLCSDGVFCNGDETCDADNDCQPGTPINCDDNVGCTVDSCNETTGSCDNIANDSLCSDGALCNGVETCDAVNDCQPGTPINCDDAVGCTVDSCNETTGSCDHVADDSLCSDGLFCNGIETCDADNDCQAVNTTSRNPCPGQSCNEGADTCVAGVKMELMVVNNVSSTQWMTVSLPDGFVEPIIICTVDQNNDDIEPLNFSPYVVRMQNLGGQAGSFDIKLHLPDALVDVYCRAIELSGGGEGHMIDAQWPTNQGWLLHEHNDQGGGR